MDTELKFYSDESLESFLLRLSQCQGYERYSHFAEDIWQETLIQHEAIPGAFPFELSRVNLYHAQTTSQMRVRVLIHLENQLKLNNYGVLRLALAHSKAMFSPAYKAIHRFNADYPYGFLRQRFTPICPQCLSDAPYIRQQWQFIPYQVCHLHHCKLIHHCPECGSRLEYQNSESIELCECGFLLSETQTDNADESELAVARWLMGESRVDTGLLATEMSISERYGVLLWYVNRYGEVEDISFDGFIKCSESWPAQLISDLDKRIEKGEITRIKSWNRTFFSEVFGDLLKECRCLPSRSLAKNHVLKTVVDYLTRLIAKTPPSNKPNIGDVLLSPLEASTLLSCVIDEVYRLYELGQLKAETRPRLHNKLSPQESVFSLRSVVEIKLSRMSSEYDGLSQYLPEW